MTSPSVGRRSRWSYDEIDDNDLWSLFAVEMRWSRRRRLWCTEWHWLDLGIDPDTNYFAIQNQSDCDLESSSDVDWTFASPEFCWIYDAKLFVFRAYSKYGFQGKHWVKIYIIQGHGLLKRIKSSSRGCRMMSTIDVHPAIFGTPCTPQSVRYP